MFFEKIRQQRREWLSKDLVVDRREPWRHYVSRIVNFGEAPKCPREELPDHLRPENSIRGKVVNYLNGVDPRVPKVRASVTHPPMEMYDVNAENDPEAAHPAPEEIKNDEYSAQNQIITQINEADKVYMPNEQEDQAD